MNFLKPPLLALLAVFALTLSAVSIEPPNAQAQMPAPAGTIADWCNPASPLASQGACQMGGGQWRGGNTTTIPTQPINPNPNPGSIYCSGPQYNAQLCGGGFPQQSTSGTSSVQVSTSASTVNCSGT